MLTLHHLETSRSDRIVWLLEELGLEAEFVRHARDPLTSRAPAALREVHPLGKSPVLVDGDLVLAESGAIVEYLVHRHGGGRLVPPVESADWPRHTYWLHFAEGSAMFPLILDLFDSLMGLPEALSASLPAERDGVLDHMEAALAEADWFGGAEFSTADVMMAFVVEMAGGRGLLEGRPKLQAYVERVNARPARVRAAEKLAG